MRNLVLLFSAVVLLACVMQKKSAKNMEREKSEVAATLVKFWQAYERKNLAAMSGMLTASSDFTFFGSDAAEVTRSRHDWEYLMQKDWQLFETTKFGEPRNLAIQISDDRKLASAVCEVQDVSLIEGRIDRFAITMRRENGDWRIVQGMTAVVTVGESSAEIVARRKSRCRKTEPNHVFSYTWKRNRVVMVSVSKSSPVRCSGRVATRKQSSDRSARSIEENGRQIILKVYLRQNLKRHEYALPPGLFTVSSTSRLGGRDYFCSAAAGSSGVPCLS